MKNSTKIALGIGTAFAAITATVITAIAGKRAENAADDCIETEGTEVEDSDESAE